MDKSQIFDVIKKKSSFLCVGLDSDILKIPTHLKQEKDPIFEFNKQIIDATHQLAIAYKPNIAFYERLGAKGWESLAKTMEYLEPLRDELFLIADAKRGDIGNTSKQYADTFFDKSCAGLNFDAITVSPYMGKDSISPFLEYKDKWTIVLALTSNDGAYDFQTKSLSEEDNTAYPLYQRVMTTSKEWGSSDQMMYVIGATKAFTLAQIRMIVPEHFLLVPGVGAQGGSLAEVAKYGMNKQCGLIVNSSRGIIFASSEKDFAAVAQQKAQAIQQEMDQLLQQYL